MKQPQLRRVLLLISSILLLATAGCASNSTIIHSYVDPTVDELQHLEGVMVIAVTEKMPARIDYEDAFVKALRRQGASAVASHTLLPGKKPTEAEVMAAARQANLDTILVTRYMGERAQEVYHPGTIYYDVAPELKPHVSDFYGYYPYAQEVAYQQPVWTSNVTYTLTSDLFTTDGKDHLWQVVSDTLKSGGKKKLRDDTIDSFVDNMKQVGLFK